MVILHEKLHTPDKKVFYEELAAQMRSMLDSTVDILANMANFSSLLFYTMPDVNWVGFYRWKNEELVLGPFHGKPACVRIALGRGVCGTAAERRATVLVEDVRAFPGHIACDAASRSEIVVPLIKDHQLLGVLDIDSPLECRFDNDDKRGLERLVAIFLEQQYAE
ncbi:MAG: GAF domain-containing protein [Bacteroidota bacterium]|nr:GAF domain-containing protein [Candidatus Kapabacteria bacterium]MDW8220859.1 GAF domain-containing protein [Bacteroidota bacterium]